MTAKKRVYVRFSLASDDPALAPLLRGALAGAVADAGQDLTGADLLNEPVVVREYLQGWYRGDVQETTGALFVNARNRLIRHDPDIYRGTLDRAVVEPREILRRALLANAAGLILYHNHPSGDPTPSREDREFTRRIAQAADLVGIRFLDHVVVGRFESCSMREKGLI